MKTPSAILTDGLASFNKAATLALTTAQENARKDLTQATTDARDARRERDEAVKALHASRLEEQAWKQEASVWKATADQAGLTINHHLETIAQLRQEATQWKNQCLRLEETSRQEAISWKEQFLRVEQERTKLAQRVEELIAEQRSAAHATITTAPYTPMVRYQLANISASARQRPSLEPLSPSLELPPSKSAPSLQKPISTVSRSRPGAVQQLPTPISENQRSARQRDAQEPRPPISRQASNGTRQILIRRVQAVVEVPVKEESVEREVLSPQTHASTSASNHASTSASATTSISAPPSKAPKPASRTAEPSKAATRVKRKVSAKRAYVEIDDESERDDGSQGSDANSDDDDELLMGVEANRKEVYGSKRVSKPASVPKTPSRPPLSTAKKRKGATKQ